VDRRKFLPGTVSILAGRAAARKPNFLFVMAEDLGSADVSCDGRRGFHAAHTPTRKALITGR
jgi:arylsulfatase A-like enzyme